MYNEIAIIFCSKKTFNENIDFIHHINLTCGCDHHIYFIYNPNNISISKIYHDVVSSNSIHENILLFINDDILFLEDNWGTELLKLFNTYNEYSIIGVAGSTEFDEMCMWWKYNSIYGKVVHNINNEITIFDGLQVDNDLQEVVVIDGLFIAIDKNKISDNFDINLPCFHFYDISFCLSNFINSNYKIGVTQNIKVLHKSGGTVNDEWFKGKEYIINKYKKYFPIHI